MNRSGFGVSHANFLPKRLKPTTIYPIKSVLAEFVDRLATVYPGNTLNINEENRLSVYRTQKITIALTSVSPILIDLIGKQFQGLPFVFNDCSLQAEQDGTAFSGSINVQIVGE